MIEFRDLTKVYGGEKTPAIADVSLTVGKGEILGLVGLNGAGKTTMIRIGSGLTMPTAGTVLLSGNDIVSQKVKASSTVGLVPEYPNFEPSAMALELLLYIGGYNGLSGADFLTHTISLLKEVGLEGQEWRKIGTFSQGMKKRFALATALLANPENLLLDEILNGLDPDGIRYIRNLLLGLKKEGRSILLSSHILVEIESVADRVAIIHKGKVLKVAPMEEISLSRERRLRVVLNNPAKQATDYLRTVGETEENGGVITVLNPTTEPWDVNRELVKLGFEVAEIVREKEDLESYFFRTIGGHP